MLSRCHAGPTPAKMRFSVTRRWSKRDSNPRSPLERAISQRLRRLVV